MKVKEAKDKILKIILMRTMLICIVLAILGAIVNLDSLSANNADKNIEVTEQEFFPDGLYLNYINDGIYRIMSIYTTGLDEVVSKYGYINFYSIDNYNEKVFTYETTYSQRAYNPNIFDIDNIDIDMKIEIIDVGKISITSDNPNSIFVGEYVNS